MSLTNSKKFPGLVGVHVKTYLKKFLFISKTFFEIIQLFLLIPMQFKKNDLILGVALHKYNTLFITHIFMTIKEPEQKIRIFLLTR